MYVRNEDNVMFEPCVNGTDRHERSDPLMLWHVWSRQNGHNHFR
jgi:hypothetical protein